MPYLYHRVPRNMQGTELYPLNSLREVDRSLYDEHVKKYLGREHLLLETIPVLGNCLWGDVIFLTAVHPTEFVKAYESTGHSLPREDRAYQFDSALLDQERLAVLKMQGPSDQYESFDPSRYDEYTCIPEETLRYWKEMEEPRLFAYIPHILYRGTLNTLTVSIVKPSRA